MCLLNPDKQTDKQLPAKLMVHVFAGFGHEKGFGIMVVLRAQTKQGLVENIKLILFIQTRFLISWYLWGSLAKPCTGESSKDSQVNDKINQRQERKTTSLFMISISSVSFALASSKAHCNRYYFPLDFKALWVKACCCTWLFSVVSLWAQLYYTLGCGTAVLDLMLCTVSCNNPSPGLQPA